MKFTESWRTVLPQRILDRYDFLETRNAAAVLSVTNPTQFQDLCDVLDSFRLLSADVLAAGGNETGIAARLNKGFRDRDWREEQAVTKVENYMRERAPKGKPDLIRAREESTNTGYFIDNVKDGVVLDVEWNAKDGNLDRDLGTYRWLYDVGFIDVAIMITREHTDLKAFGQDMRQREGQEEKAVKAWLGTTTTTSLSKLETRLKSGNAGGCPFLAVGITKRTWEHWTPNTPGAV